MEPPSKVPAPGERAEPPETRVAGRVTTATLREWLADLSRVEAQG